MRRTKPAEVFDGTPSQPLDRRRGPLYRQFARILRDQISDGTFPIGTHLPTEAALASRFAISLITVRTGLRELESEGLIRKRSAKPAVVAASEPLVRPSIDFHSFAAIVESTRNRRLQIRSYEPELAPAAAEIFGRSRNEPFFVLRALIRFTDRPVSQNTIYFPREIGSQLVRADFDDVVVFRSVQRKLGIRLSGARVTLKAEAADAAAAEDLDCPEGGPLFVAEMLYRSAEGTPVEYSIARNRPDTFSVTYDAPNDIS